MQIHISAPLELTTKLNNWNDHIHLAFSPVIKDQKAAPGPAIDDYPAADQLGLATIGEFGLNGWHL